MEIFITDLEAYNNWHFQGKNICSYQHDHEEIFITYNVKEQFNKNLHIHLFN